MVLKVRRLNDNFLIKFAVTQSLSHVRLCNPIDCSTGSQASLSFTICWSFLKLMSIGASLVTQLVKNPLATQKTSVQSLGWEDPLEKGRLPTPIFWPGEFHGLHTPWSCKESEQLFLSLSCLLSW